MFQLLLIRLWPALIPLIVYYLWHRRRLQRVRQAGEELPRLLEGPWLATCLTALALAALSLLVAGFMQPKRNHMAYTPPHLENGEVVKGRLDAQP